MPQLRSIFLVANDEHPHSPAFERSRALALATGARVHIGAFCYSGAIAALGAVSGEAMDNARAGLVAKAHKSAEQQALFLRDMGVEASSSAVWAHPALQEILLQVDEQKSDILIKDVHREPLLRRIVASSLDQQLIRACKLPVMLVVDDDRPLPRRILVAADVMEGSSELNSALMRHARGLALQSDAELHMAYVSEPFGSMGSEVVLSAAANVVLEAEVRKSRIEAFQRFADAAQLPQERRHYLDGFAATTLCSFAAENAVDVIVAANANRSRMERWLLGSTAEQIVQHSPCSLLTVPIEILA